MNVGSNPLSLSSLVISSLVMSRGIPLMTILSVRWLGKA